MLKFILLLLFAFAIWQGYNKFRHPEAASAPEQGQANASWTHYFTDNNKSEKQPQFSCDGRTYCSQMTSCEEATFFLKNCPGVEMDGDGNGIPCERQWCGQ